MDASKLISDSCQKFLSQIGFSSEVSIMVQFEPATQTYQILLQTQNPSILIGFHGENLAAIQLLFSQHLHSQTGEWHNLSLNVNDYRERRQFTLHSLADTAVSRVITTQKPHSLPPMSASERRIVHLYLTNHPHVSTSSQGTGRSRCIIVSPKS